MIIGKAVVAIKRLYKAFMSKSVKQRIIICIVITTLLTLLFFIIKANIFDVPLETAEENGQTERPQFHISLIDVGLLLAAIAAFSIHKIREKRKQRRL